MPTLTASTIVGGAWKSLYDILTGSSGITDPKSRGLARTKWVMPAFPDINKSDFPGYPIIVMVVDESFKPYLFNRQGRDIRVSYMITIFADKNEHVDTLSDDILNIVTTLQSTMEGYKLFNPTLTSTSTTTEFRSPEDKIHMKTLFIDYEVQSL